MMNLILVFIFLAGAELDTESEDALKNVQKLMLNPTQRKSAISHDPQLKAMDANIDQFANGNPMTKEAVYNLSTKVFETIVRKSQGDPEKMKLLLNEAQNNPEKFYKENFTPTEQAEIRRIANEVEKAKAPPTKSPK